MKPRSVSSPDDPVEGAGQRVGGGGDLLLQRGVLAFHPEVALGDPDPGFPVGFAVNRMATHLLA